MQNVVHYGAARAAIFDGKRVEIRKMRCADVRECNEKQDHACTLCRQHAGGKSKYSQINWLSCIFG